MEKQVENNGEILPVFYVFKNFDVIVLLLRRTLEKMLVMWYKYNIMHEKITFVKAEGKNK